MRELSVGDGKSNPFKLFARRAQLVITGLMHISILLLPKPLEDLPSHKAPAAAGGPANGCTSGGAGGKVGGGAVTAGAAAANHGTSSSGTACPAPHTVLAEMQAAGSFPADGSDLESWDRVRLAPRPCYGLAILLAPGSTRRNELYGGQK